MAASQATVDVAVRLSEIPHVDQYTGMYAVHPESFERLVQVIETTDIETHVIESRAAIEKRDVEDQIMYGVEDGVAEISMIGTLTKYGSSFSQNPGMVKLRRAVRMAAEDTRVASILLRIDSPGGSVAGTGDLAAAVAQAAKTKPVTAYIEDMGASGAYWIASQANRVVANENAIVGSIGTYAVVMDFSEHAKRVGVEVHVLKAGEFKGAGEPGTKITDAQLAEWQRVVEDLNEIFVRSVATGRSMGVEQVKALADGRVHVGANAMSLGLVDAIEPLETTVKALIATDKRPAIKNEEDSVMSDSPEQGATSAQLRKAFPNSSAEWREQIVESNCTLAEATELYAAELEEQLAKAKAENAKLEEKVAASEEKDEGVDAVETDVEESAESAIADPVAELDREVGELMKRGIARPKAVGMVCQRRPELQDAYLKATNKGRKVHALIEERRELLDG